MPRFADEGGLCRRWPLRAATLACRAHFTPRSSQVVERRWRLGHLRGDEPPIVVVGELKFSFSLDLVLQAVDRTAACDEVWLAVGAAARGRLRDPRVHKLCSSSRFRLTYHPVALSKFWSSSSLGGRALSDASLADVTFNWSAPRNKKLGHFYCSCLICSTVRFPSLVVIHTLARSAIVKRCITKSMASRKDLNAVGYRSSQVRPFPLMAQSRPALCRRKRQLLTQCGHPVVPPTGGAAAFAVARRMADP